MAATSAPGTAGVMMTSMNMEQRRAEEKAKSDKESIEAKPSSTEDNTQSTMEDFRHPINSYEKTQEQPAIGTISSLVGAMFGISPDTKEPGKDNNRNKGKGPKVG